MHLEVRKVWGLENESNMMTIKIAGEAQPVFGLQMLHFTKTTGDLYAALGSQQVVQNDRHHHKISEASWSKNPQFCHIFLRVLDGAVVKAKSIQREQELVEIGGQNKNCARFVVSQAGAKDFHLC